MRRKWITFIVAIVPILSLYSIGIAGISVSDVILFGLCFYDVLSTRRLRYRKGIFPILIFMLYLLLSSMISTLFFPGRVVTIMIRLIRWLFYIYCSVVLPKHLDVKFMLQMTAVVAVACFVAIFIQTVAYNTSGKYVTLFIPGLSLNNEVYEDSLSTSAYFRPSAFFGEPASLVWYVLPVLNYALYKLDKSFTVKGLLWAIILSMTIVMSKSLFGLLFLGVLWVIWALHFISFRKNMKLPGIFLFIALPILAVYVLQTDMVQEALVRIDFSDLEGSDSFSGRFLQYEVFNSLSSVQRIFGVGIGNLMGAENINNAFAYLLTGSGILGILLLAFCYVNFFRSTRKYVVRVLLLCTIIMSFGSNALLSVNLVYYFSFVHICNALREDETDQPLELCSEVSQK